jgi:2-methylcitrate dehydratase PrpD
MESALGLAAEQACGLQAMRTEDGHMNKSLHMGVGARNGVASAYLAQAGYGGVFDVLDPPYSLFEAFAGGAAQVDEVTRDLGTRFEILVTAIKRWSAGHPMNSAIEALFATMDREGLQASDIDTIEVRVETLIKQMLSQSPTLNVNIEYVVAVAALDRDVTWDAYTDERRRDPVLLDLLARTTSVAGADLDAEKAANPGARPTDVTVRAKDGRTFTHHVRYPPGHPRNPLGPEELADKFMYWSTRVLSADRAAQLMATVMDIEAVEDVNALSELLLVRAPAVSGR